jgi:hypothetical protein
MKFFKRGKDKKKEGSAGGGRFVHGSGGGATGKSGDLTDLQFQHGLPRPTETSAGLIAELPPPILKRIFAFVCPHSQDESYEACEESYTENACMLCDLRDLAHCVQTCKAWAKTGRKLM